MPAPTGGWNARDALDSMPSNEAVILKNWFPRIGKVVSRPGYTQHCDTGSGAAVDAIFHYESDSATKILAVSDGEFFDCTTSTPSSLVSGLTAAAGNWIGVMFGSYMHLCNGTDNAKRFDGTTLANTSHTGVTATTWRYVHVHNSRLYVAVNDSASFWYSAANAAASGALSEFDLSLAGKFRGNLEIICSLSRDGGAGPDDYIAFISSAGDVLVYSGTDPNDASNWSQIGEYTIGRPLGVRASTQADADVIVLTDRGYESLSVTMRKGDAIEAKDYLSYKIQNEVFGKIEFAGFNDKWQVAMLPLEQMMIVTVPRAGTDVIQHVRNSNTGAWSEFDIAAQCWADGILGTYLGGDTGIVHRFSNGAATDGGTTGTNGSAIETDVQTAWTYLGYRNQLKKLNFVRQAITYSVLPAISINVGTDFNGVARPTQAIIPASDDGSYAWDDAGSVWGTAVWGGGSTTRHFIYKQSGLGYAFAQRVTISADVAQLEWGAATYHFEMGHFI